VQVADIVRVLLDNAERAKTLVTMVAPRLKEKRPSPCPAGCDHALEHALITAPAVRSADMIAKLDAVAGRVLKK
jgi:5'-methylthioadenosine phosphorylase